MILADRQGKLHESHAEFLNMGAYSNSDVKGRVVVGDQPFLRHKVSYSSSVFTKQE